MKLVLLLSSLLFSAAAFAGDCHCGIRNLPYDFSDLIEHVNVIGYQDLRTTYEKYAADNNMTVDAVYEKFNANNRLYCPGTSSINLVKKDVALGVAHAFYDENCKPRAADFTKCYLQTTPPPPAAPLKYYIQSVDVGTTCPYKNPDKLDYAVVKFQDKIPGVHPYKITSACQLNLDYKGINVQALAQNFKIDNRFPPNIGPCGARDLDGVNGSYKTTCSAGNWASGSGLVCDSQKRGESPAIAGLVVASTDDPKTDHTPFHSQDNYTTAIPISEEMIEKINRM
jgi:hypothetical protein